MAALENSLNLKFHFFHTSFLPCSLCLALLF
jgi:hypothetical protein